MNNYKLLLKQLNDFHLHKWVNDYEGCVRIIDNIKKIESQLEKPVDEVMKKELENIIEQKKILKKYALKYGDIRDDENSDYYKVNGKNIVGLIIKTRPYSYIARMIAINPEVWNPWKASERNIKKGIRAIESEDNLLECLFDVNQDNLVGEIWFSSLGVSIGNLISKKELLKNKEESTENTNEQIKNLINEITENICFS